LTAVAKVREPIDFESDVLDAARAEAARRGVAVSEVVDEAVRRYIAGGALVALLGRFSAEDAKPGSILTDDEANAIATQELDAYRSSRRAG
jgi:hypothetical protein